ncbi:hypothetical protein TSOC_010678, partial [Tetrabaena socialis]
AAWRGVLPVELRFIRFGALVSFEQKVVHELVWRSRVIFDICGPWYLTGLQCVAFEAERRAAPHFLRCLALAVWAFMSRPSSVS